MKRLREENLSNFIIIASYQEPVNTLMISQFDKFTKSMELYNPEKTFMMESLSPKHILIPLIKFFLSKNENFESLIPNTNFDKQNYEISEDLINFLLSKSFNGNPLLIQEILNRFVEKKLIKCTYNTSNNQFNLTCEEFLLEMIKFRDWSKIDIPYRIEKLMGNIIDNLNPKEIIILKCASVIGTVFDINTLYLINPFDTIMNEDLLAMIYHFEQLGIIEILYDLEVENLVAKFSLPFFREVIYSRMLSEQKTSIHLEIARNFKTPKFSYMDADTERKTLLRHLIESENTVMNCMEKKEKGKIKYHKF